MKLACLRAGQLLERRAAGLSPADGLRLEEHLSGCPTCRADANLLAGLRQLQSEAAPTLRAEARQRAIAAAFQASPEHRAPISRPQRAPTFALLAAAAVIVLVGTFALKRQPTLTPTQPTAAAAQPESADRLLSGQLDPDSAPSSRSGALSDHATLKTSSGAVVALAHAQVELRPQSAATWNASTRTLALAAGSVMVEVDPAPHRSFTVEAQAFTVQVLGTRFEVTQTSVHLLRGRVAVQPKSATANSAPVVLEAGTEHTHYELAPATPDSSASALPPSPATRSSQHADGTSLLEQARSELAGGNPEKARRLLHVATPRLRSAELRAEALSLEAECHMHLRHYSQARDTYLRVVKKFAALPAAETALFAAARVEAEHGQAAQAQALLRRYLARYPRGSFVREVQRRLQPGSEPTPDVPERGR